MPPIVLETLQSLKGFVGREIATTDWCLVTQDRIRQFAEATEDRQWIHVDPERAERESPYGATIAHGFLTLSLLSYFMKRAIQIASKLFLTFPSRGRTPQSRAAWRNGLFDTIPNSIGRLQRVCGNTRVSFFCSARKGFGHRRFKHLPVPRAGRVLQRVMPTSRTDSLNLARFGGTQGRLQ